MAQFNVKDIDAANGIVTKFAGMPENIVAVTNIMTKMGEDMKALDQTAGMSSQVDDYLSEAATALRGMIPGIEEAGKQLNGIVNSAAQFAEAQAANALGSV